MSVELTKEELLDAMAESYSRRLRSGQRPTVDEYVKDHPQWADEIRELFETLSIVEASGEADEKLPGRIGDFRILRCAGRGGMGVVYEAVQESLGRRVALKVLPRQASLANPTYLRRFHREARAVAALHHTNIVPVFGIGEHDGMHYYVMQFIDGQGLDKVLEEVKRLQSLGADADRGDRAKRAAKTPATSVAQRLLSGGFGTGTLESQTPPLEPANTSRSITGAAESTEPSLAAANANALAQHPLADNAPAAKAGAHPERSDDIGASGVHMPAKSDLAASSSESPAEYFNGVARIGIQVSEALSLAHGLGVLHRDIKPSNLLLDTRGTAWVTDFGLAKTDASDDLTHTGDVVGTLRYLAPERLRGDSDPRSDVYSLGLTLYEMLTLRPAFDETSRDRLVLQILHEEPSRPRNFDARIPRDLETIVLKAIAKEPARRYQTAADLAEDLRRQLANQPIHARPITSPERLWRWCRRNPAVASLTSAVMLLTLIVAGVATVAALWLRAERDAAVAAEQREFRARATAETEAESARIEAIKSRRINEFLETMLASADPGNSRGNEVTVQEVLNQAAANLETELLDQPEISAALHDTIGWTYLRLGDFSNAETHLRAALAIGRRLPQSPQFATTLDHVSHLLDATNRTKSDEFQEALRLCREAIATRREMLGPDHPDTAASVGYLSYLEHRSGNEARSKDTMAQLAMSLGVPFVGGEELKQALARLRGLWASGQHDEALRFVEETIAPLREKLGSGPAMADGLRMMGLQRMNLKDYNAAQPLLVAAMELYIQEYGDDHPTVVVCQRLISRALYGKGQYEQAEEFLQKSLAVGRKVFGDHHFQVGATMYDLGRIYHRKLDRPEDAEKMYRESLAIDRQALDSDQPNVTRTIQALGQLLQYRLGKFDEAESLYREVLAIRREALGDDHELVAWTMYYLADLLHYDKGEIDEAEDLYRQALAIRRKALGEQDERVGRTMYHLAKLLHYKKTELAEAESFYRESLAILRNSPGSEADDEALTLYDLAVLHESGKRDYAQAEAFLREALAIRQKADGDGHQKTLQVGNRLARLLANCPDPRNRKPDEALTLAQGGVKHAPNKSGYWGTLGMAYYRTGDAAAAIQALKKSNELLGRGSTTNRFFLAMAHWQLEQYDEARRAYEAAAGWMDSHAPVNQQLAQYRAEAASVLGIAPTGSAPVNNDVPSPPESSRP